MKHFLVMICLFLTGVAPAYAAGPTGMGGRAGWGAGANLRFPSGPQIYDSFLVEVSEDPFINPGRFSQLTGGMNFIDDNGDGIADLVQNTELFRGLNFGDFVDANNDSIHDGFQNHTAYQALGLTNFVDVDGDGLCDNYRQRTLLTSTSANPRSGSTTQAYGNGAGRRAGRGPGATTVRFPTGPLVYDGFLVEVSEDLFINPARFSRITGGMNFIDDNGDGIADTVQNTELFRGLNFGDFVDANNDSIHDGFQNRTAYQALGLANFVDVDGDGLCDNYELLPRTALDQ